MAKTVEIPSGTVILVFLDDFLPKVKVVSSLWVATFWFKSTVKSVRNCGVC